MENTFDQLIEAIGNNTTPIEFHTTPARLFILISHLQLALRHPGNTGSSAAIIRDMIARMTEAIAQFHPEARELIASGRDETFDMAEEQFELTRGDNSMLEQMRLSNASNLLIEHSRAIGQPVIMAANAEMTHADGVQPGNPETADLEIIRGLSFSIACDQFMAQYLISGITGLLQQLEESCDPFETASAEIKNTVGVCACAIVAGCNQLEHHSHLSSSDDWLILVMAQAQHELGAMREDDYNPIAALSELTKVPGTSLEIDSPVLYQIINLHALAVMKVAEHLGEAIRSTDARSWLSLIIQHGQRMYRDSTPQEFNELLKRILTASGERISDE